VSPDLKPPIGANRVANKLPFTDEQLADIIKACDEVNADNKNGRWGNRFGSGEWTGEDLKDFIWLMTYTGLRISEVRIAIRRSRPLRERFLARRTATELPY
jgi:hypothetical protein